jgi:NodT family efflux transporter outer membrane factor (OMF) lipoprotein
MTFKKKLIIFSSLILICLPVSANTEYMNFDWWKNYHDDILINHLETLYSNNHNLKIAAYKTKQAEENIRLASSNQLPHVGIDAELTRTMRGAQTEFGDVIIPRYSQNNFLLPLSASYEVDIWGENYLTRKSAKKQKEIALQEERATYIYLTSTFVANYFNLMKADELEKVTREIIDIQSKVVSMTEKKYNLGLAPIQELLNEKQLLVKEEESLNKVLENKKIINNSLITLLGENTDKEVEHSALKDLNYPQVPQSISATAIQHRPDLIESEKYAQKAGIDVSIAKREFLPKFILWGNIGFNAYRWNSIFNNTTFLSNIGVVPSWDIFTGGRKMAKYKINKYEYKKAGEMYQQTVLNSIQELNDALVQAKTTSANLEKSEQDFEIENQKYKLSVKAYSTGNSSKLDEMRANLNLLVSEQRHISSQINDVISTISLYNAVGGVDYTKEENL